MGFAPLEEIEGPIVLTLRGKEYTLPVVTMEKGVNLQHRIAEGGLTVGELAYELLGPVLEELATDGASPGLVERVTAVALAEWKFGREAAEKAWADPKALLTMIEALNRAVTAAQTTLQGGDSTTPRPVSGSGTKAQAKRKAAPSRGKRSSGTGPSS